MHGLVGGVRQVRCRLGERLYGACSSRSTEGRVVLLTRRIPALDPLLHVPRVVVQTRDRPCGTCLAERKAVDPNSSGYKALDSRPLLFMAALVQCAVQVGVLLRETAHGNGG